MRQKTIEDYVELIFDLQKGKNKVHTNELANSLNINPASVTETLQKLSDEGFIFYEKYSGANLTSKGKKLAIKTKEKHEKLMEFLMLLGVNRKIAEKDACEMEHILHESTMDVIIKFVEILKNCESTPFWLNRLKEYIQIGKIPKCPDELLEICLRYSKK